MRLTQAMKRMVLIAAALLLLLLMVLLATWAAALPAHAVSPKDPGPVGYRYLPEIGRAYCDNFYNGPPQATTPAGGAWQGVQLEQVYWCYSESKGYWVPTSASI